MNRPRLVIRSGGRVREIEFRGARMRIGREPPCEVRLDDIRVSRAHCMIERDGAGFRVRDLGSHNGTRVNGKRVREAPLEWGDIVEIGDSRIILLEAPGRSEAAGAYPVRRRRRDSVTETISMKLADLRTELVAVTPDLVEYLQGLFELTQVLRRPPGEEALLEQLQRILSRRFRAERCTVAMLDSPAAKELDPELLKRAIEEEEVVLLGHEGGSLVYAPIQGSGRVLGVIGMEGAEFGEAHLNALGVAARQIGMALENFRYVRGLEFERKAARAGLELVGRSEGIERVRRMIDRVAGTESTVLIRGESGTGKEIVARLIHSKSRRARGPFVAVNCGAIPEAIAESEMFGHERGAFTGADTARPGLFEEAEDGTLFLDEIGELTPGLQAKLLRVLEARTFMRVGGRQERHTNARVIAATHFDLRAAVEDGRFRQDLYYRLNVVDIAIPPLRERPEDVEPMAKRFLEELRPRINPRVRGFRPEAIEALRKRAWPGNGRELRNVVERALIVAAGEWVEEADLGHEGPEAGPVSLEEFEKAHIARVLRMTGGNRTDAARLLGIHRSTLHEKIKAYGIRV